MAPDGTVPSPPGGENPRDDVAAVAADDALLDEIAAGAPAPSDDPVAALLAGWVAVVDAEPLPVWISGADVAQLWDFLRRAEDWEHATPQERADARVEMCGYLRYVLRVKRSPGD